MTRPAKALAITALALLAIPVGCSLLLAASIATSGLVTVRVHETSADGTNLYLPVPAALIYVGLDVLPLLARFDHHGELARARRDLGTWKPAVSAALQSLEDCPDAVLVDVQEHGETVRIVKQGSKINLDVHGDEGTVSLSFPAHLFGHIAKSIA